MIKKKFISDHDIQLFQDAFKDVRPLKQKHAKAHAPSIPKKSWIKPHAYPTGLSNQKPPFHDTTAAMPSSYIPNIHEAYVQPEETLFFARPGIQKKQLQKLKKGQILITTSLDLHGMRFQDALQALETLFSPCLAPQRCFCIIHGKGKPQEIPVLKNLVNQFLKQHPHVLAFCSAPLTLGGAGATLVLLKSTLHGAHA